MTPNFDTRPSPAIPLKQWLYDQAARLHRSFEAVSERYHRGYCLPVATLRLNPRVVYVLPGQQLIPTCTLRRHPSLAGLRGNEYQAAYMRMIRKAA